MNIFVLDKDPIIAAQMYCDKHIIKMILEMAQMLSTAHRVHQSKVADLVYKQAHLNHPCTKWVRSTFANYGWAYTHFVALCNEYISRYDKIHLTDFKLRDLLSINPCPEGVLEEFTQAMPEQYKNRDPVIAYRAYYIGEKGSFAKWKYNLTPFWFSMNMPYLCASVDYIDCNDDSLYGEVREC